VNTVISKKSILEEIIEQGGVLIAEGLSKEVFNLLTQLHPELQMEREKNGNITIMTPVKGGSGMRENILNLRIAAYCELHLGGQTFSPSTGFDLPDGSTKSPDVAWLSPEKMELISGEELEEEFIRIVPDFIAELRSKSDSLARLKRKMTDTWIANGVRLAWLIDPYEEKAYIYRLNGSIDVVDSFDGKLSGEDTLEGFELELAEFRLLGRSDRL
jgi:Uma2 family endonuclease